MSDHHGTAGFTTRLDVANHLADDEQGSQIVEVTTLDRLEPELLTTLGRIDVVKVDVEGADLAVLRGARALLERHHPTVIVEIWEGGREIRAFLADIGYRLFRFGYDLPRARLEELAKDFDSHGNLIAVHFSRLETITLRLARSRAELRAPKVRWFPAR